MSLENTTWIAESVNSTNKETEKIWLLSYILYQAVSGKAGRQCMQLTIIVVRNLIWWFGRQKALYRHIKVAKIPIFIS